MECDRSRPLDEPKLDDDRQEGATITKENNIDSANKTTSNNQLLTAEAQKKQGHQRRRGDESEGSGQPTEKRMKTGEINEYHELLGELATRLKLAHHPNPATLLKAARLVLSRPKDDRELSLRSGVDHGEHVSMELHEQRQQQSAQMNDGDDDTKTATRKSPSAGESARLSGGDGQAGQRWRGTAQKSKFTLYDVSLPKALVESSTTGPTVCDSNELENSVQESVDHGRVLERAAKALKLLYLDDQRRLQNQVNDLISSIQSITANPKTDPRLLATGR